jgi:hypothetical protein
MRYFCNLLFLGIVEDGKSMVSEATPEIEMRLASCGVKRLLLHFRPGIKPALTTGSLGHEQLEELEINTSQKGNLSSPRKIRQ